jgi:long-chain acyl-CoA synthetase
MGVGQVGQDREIRGFWRAAEAEPRWRALVTADGGFLTAGELLAANNRVVHGLRARGLARGDSVALLLPNGAEAIEVLLATMQAGWYVTPINTNLAPAEIAHILADSEARAFVTHEAFAEKSVRAADEAGLPEAARIAVGEVPGFRSYAELTGGQPDHRPDDRVAGQFMQYTSGTTGRPKGIKRPIYPIDPDVMASMLAAHLARFGIAPGPPGVHLCTSPMYHTAPLAYTTFSLHFEHTAVLMEKWDPETALRLIEAERVTTTHMVPTQFHRLLLLPEEVRGRYDVSSLRNVLHAAAPCPVDVKRRMLAWWGPVIYEYYGATEGGGTLITPEEWLARPGSVGRAWEGAEIRILDDEGNACARGEPGTVYMKLIQDFDYKGDAAKTREGRRGDFFTVGDVGYLDDDGYLFLCDRKIDMIISGGVNIYPAEVEAVLFSHPGVGDAAVFGVPDDDWGEQVKAAIEVAPGAAAGPALARELLAFCAERLAKYKCPRSIDFVDAMPRDPNGKLYKRKLRDPYWEGRERAI